MSSPTHLAVGLLKKAHGVPGDVLVYPLTDQPEQVFRGGRELLVLDRATGAATGAVMKVKRARAYHRAWLVHFEGLDDRTQVQALGETYLGITVGEARPLAEGEFFLHELVGLAVQTLDKAPVGTVVKVYEAPQGLLLSVVDGAKEHLIPFRPGIVRRVDRAERMVTVDPPAGLLDL